MRCAGISDCRGALMYLVYTFSHDGCSNSRCLGSRSLLAACQRGSEAVWPVWALGPTCARLRRTRTQVCFVRQVELHRLARLLLGCVALIGRQLSSAQLSSPSRPFPQSSQKGCLACGIIVINGSDSLSPLALSLNLPLSVSLSRLHSLLTARHTFYEQLRC